MPSFQSPVADQRQAVRADREAAVEGPRAVLEQRGVLLGDHRLEERVVLAGAEGRPFEEGHHLVEHPDDRR